jgi:magnesium chelatase family protein
VLEYLRSPSEEKLPREPVYSFNNDSPEGSSAEYEEDFADVNGQDAAKRAAMISAAGFHSFLMTGPPGVGKSLIAKRIPSIMPPLSREESLEVTTIYSVAGKLPPGSTLIRKRGFESPHHTVTLPALIGGGQNPRPGAISLAHRSVLFLDELTEFDRKAIDSLRQPLEDHEVHISRARYSISYPADFLLVCAMNPCPCGYYPDRNKCRCTDNAIRKYLGRVSGPILDRIDLCVQMSPVSIKDISAGKNGITSAEMRSRVILARIAQKKRYEGTSYRFNSEIKGSDLEKYCPLNEDEKTFLGEMFDKLGLSVRSYHRIIRVARTIADIEGSDPILREHILEAASYRPNFEYWMT